MQAFPLGFEKVKNFTEIFDKGKKFKTFSSQIIVYLEETEIHGGKLSLGVLALKKIVGKKAVCRNKAKRRFKHGLLKSLSTVALNKGFNIKVVALTNKNTLACPWSQILADIEKELRFINSEIQKKEPRIE
ncbi:MAG: ribonuclease P protein component [Bdellovibrionota bacterium]